MNTINRWRMGLPEKSSSAAWRLAHGYHQRPELTAERFVERLGQRLYRTGDLGRQTAAGVYEYLGRADNQVKIRGHRVELGEIEVALNAHPAVRQAAVAVHELASGIKQLAAYVCARPGTVLETGELRGFLAQRLPDYMVPASFQKLDAMPLTPSGKVDRHSVACPLDGSTRVDPGIQRTQAGH